MTYHTRGIVDSLEQNNFVFGRLVIEFWQSGYLLDPYNYLTLVTGITLLIFPACAFIIEKAASLGYLNNIMVIVLEISYLSFLLVYPIILIQWCSSKALPATYLMLFAVSLFLKLTSFHHVMYDNRYLMSRIKKVKGQPEQAKIEDLATLYNVNEGTFAIAIRYPNNLSVTHYLRFIFAPTCCYQHVYPTSPNIRIGYLFKRVMEVALCYMFMWYLIY